MKKGVVLLVVLGTMLIILGIALVALYLMRQQSRLVEDKVRRIRAFYSAQAGIVHTLDRLRREGTYNSTVVIGNNLTGYPPGGFVVNITTIDNLGPENTSIINASVEY